MTDRLAGLLRHYTLSARVFHSGPLCGQQHYAEAHGYLHVLRHGRLVAHAAGAPPRAVDTPSLLFYPRPLTHRFVTVGEAPADLVCAAIELGSAAGNPLATALPPALHVPLAEIPTVATVLDLLFDEAGGTLCGRQAAIDRLCELLLIGLLRHLMSTDIADTGLLAGLADARLAKAITAMHDAPGDAWTLDTLAARAGMSRARFAAHFHHVVGLTPGHYLTRWRVNLAGTLIARGQPINVVAGHVGYGSATALSRAFRAHTGHAPSAWRKQHS